MSSSSEQVIYHTPEWDLERVFFCALGVLVWVFIIRTVLGKFRERRALQEIVDQVPDVDEYQKKED